MAQPLCHYCEDDASTQCATCGRMYCDEHGEDVCLRCMAPESATPAMVAYRGALVALVVGTLVAVFLVVSPPGSANTASGTTRPLPVPGQQMATVTPTLAVRATGTVAGVASPGASASATAGGSATVGASATAGANVTATPGGQRTHVVVAGNTLSGIAREYGTTVAEILALNPGVTADNITIGQTLRIPAR